MHFSIPDTQEFIDAAGNTYVVSIFIIYYISNYILMHIYFILIFRGITFI